MYEKLIDSNISKFDKYTSKKLPIDYKGIIADLTSFYAKPDCKSWNSDQINKLPEILAHIFAIWSLQNSQTLQKLGASSIESKGYLLQPHPSQVVSIFRILGLGYEGLHAEVKKLKAKKAKSEGPYPKAKDFLKDIKKKFKNMKESIFGRSQDRMLYDNLVQIKTGEGKSVTLAITAAVFALFGFHVNVACYSKYLSKRDYQAFAQLFTELNIADKIFYGSFNEVCEKNINQEGNLREVFRASVLKNAPKVKILKETQNFPQILLIDEVDVFFSKDFFGNVYCPSAEIQDPAISQFLDYMWDQRYADLTFKTISQSQEYLECKNIFKDEFSFLFEEAIRDLIPDLKERKDHKYHPPKNGKIGYKDQDQISYNINYGYKTLFAYYEEFQAGTISQEQLDVQKGLVFNIGQYSYAEIPKNMLIILGVTGTLSTLTEQEKKIVEEIYNIKHNTLSPSPYGISQLIYVPKSDLIITNQNEYYNKIINNITDNLKTVKGIRAVLVFFKTEHLLMQFFNSLEFAFLKNSSQLLVERCTQQERELIVQKATYRGQITLSTKAFGRGTDFICSDKMVNEAGGLHVISTFLSWEESEEVQIKGRTARQGSNGTFNLVLLDEDLKEFNINDVELRNIKQSEDKQKTIKQYRDFTVEKEHKDNSAALEQMKLIHSRTDMAMNTLKRMMSPSSFTKQVVTQEDLDEAKKLLKDVNRGRGVAEGPQKQSKTLVLIDATGSMTSMLTKTKNAVDVMYERAQKCLEDNRLDPSLFSMMIGFYRNYSSTPAEIFEHSQWETKPKALREFMSRIQCKGGQGNEAMEIGFWFANQVRKNCGEVPLSQVFVFADAPANTSIEVKQKRENEKKWQGTPYEDPTYWMDEIKELKKANIPVFSFFIVPKNASENIKQQYHAEFSKYICNGGTCQQLNIDDEVKGQEELTDLVTNQILQMVGQINGGQEVANKLLASYKKSYKN